jgi:hypothetical protein
VLPNKERKKDKHQRAKSVYIDPATQKDNAGGSLELMSSRFKSSLGKTWRPNHKNKNNLSWMLVAHTYNLSYSESRDQED